MNEPIDIESVRTEALRKLGRNVVNFSKIEASLKYLLSVSQLEGTGKAISNQVYRNQTRLKKKTLGSLVQEFNRNILSASIPTEPETTFSETEISISLKVTCNSQSFFESQKRALREVVVERNKLIHTNLAFLDTSSVDDYRKLISLLDEQNPRLLAHLEDLAWIINSFLEGLKSFEELSKSPNFPHNLQSDRNNT